MTIQEIQDKLREMKQMANLINIYIKEMASEQALRDIYKFIFKVDYEKP